MRRQLAIQTGEKQFDFWVRGYHAATYNYASETIEFTTLNAPEKRSVLKSLSVMHKNINGIAFGAPGAAGRIIEADTTARRGAYSLGFRQILQWISPESQLLLTETRTARIAPGPCDGCLLDLSLHYHTSEDSSVTFGQTNVSFLRGNVPSPLLPTGGGHIRNSLGLYGIEAVHGQAAAWVGAIGVVQNETVGFAWLDHPQNPWHPTLWNVCAEGILSPSPFAWREYTLPSSTDFLLRYRLLAHRGYVEQGWADARLAEFAQTPPPA